MCNEEYDLAWNGYKIQVAHGGHQDTPISMLDNL